MLVHAVDVRREIVIAADADAVWGIVADAARQAEWFPGMVSSSVDGEIRTVTTAVGGFLLEEILDVDHDARRFEYRITGPIHLEHHRGRITVLDDPDGARVVYEQEMEPKSLVYVLNAAIGDALDGLRDLVLDGRTSRSYVAAVDPVSGRRTEAGS
jgi:carbon monoxide dehydrogenase subunit G